MLIIAFLMGFIALRLTEALSDGQIILSVYYIVVLLFDCFLIKVDYDTIKKEIEHTQRK